MIKTRRTLVLSFLFIALCFAFNNVHAQDNSYGERVMFVEIDDLDPYNYKEIVEGIADNDNFSVKQACIPAGILMLEIPSSNSLSLDQNFSSFKGEVMESSDLENMKIIAEYSEEDFNTRCAQFRMRQPEK